MARGFKSKSIKFDAIIKLEILAERGHRSLPEQISLLADEEIERRQINITPEEYQERLQSLSK